MHSQKTIRMCASPPAGMALILALALALTACASGGRGRGDEPSRRQGATLNPAGLMIAGSDANGDYVVTAAELAAGIARGFAIADRNGDGALSLIELGDWRAAAFGSAQALPGPFAFDTDQNSSVSEAEFGAAIRAAAAPYAAADGSIPFAALSRQAEDRAEYFEETAAFQQQRGPLDEDDLPY